MYIVVIAPECAQVLRAMGKASMAWYEKPRSFREIMLADMKAAYSWSSVADEYLILYNRISGKW